MAAKISAEDAGKPMEKLIPCKSPPPSKKAQGDFRKTRGLGKKLWKSIDVDTYVKKEREEWD